MASHAQSIVNLAARKGCQIKRFANPKRIRFINKFTTVNATLYENGSWVGFDDERTGMSGNDPVSEFKDTLQTLLSRQNPF